MQVLATAIPGVLLLEPRVHVDARGFLFESYNRRALAEVGVTADFVQDNHSRSRRNVLRGLHYQIREPQGKLVRVVAGEVLDVALDLRRASPTFGQWTSFVLSAENKRIVWLPPGLAHGFVVRSAQADFLYKTTAYWMPNHERTILWNDPDLAIDWQLSSAPILSPKDQNGTRFREAEVYP
jgi:dTDP-4-dehydrorhamnose 3,5-epimerase